MVCYTTCCCCCFSKLCISFPGSCSLDWKKTETIHYSKWLLIDDKWFRWKYGVHLGSNRGWHFISSILPTTSLGLVSSFIIWHILSFRREIISEGVLSNSFAWFEVQAQTVWSIKLREYRSSYLWLCWLEQKTEQSFDPATPKEGPNRFSTNPVMARDRGTWCGFWSSQVIPNSFAD